MSIKQGAGIKNSQRRETTTDLEQLKKLLDENIQLTKNLEERTKKIHGYIKWLRVWSILKIIIILAPIILGIIFLPSILGEYQEVFNGLGELSDVGTSLDLNSLINGL